MAVTVLAIIKAKPGMEARVEQALKDLIEPTRQESGCINYDLHVLMDKPGEFMFYENWQSKERLDDHLNRPHLQDFLAQAEEILAEPVSISLFRKID